MNRNEIGPGTRYVSMCLPGNVLLTRCLVWRKRTFQFSLEVMMRAIRIRHLVCQMVIWSLVLCGFVQPASQAEGPPPLFRSPSFDRADNLYFVDSYSHSVLRVDTLTGQVAVVAGSGQEGEAGGGFIGDGGPATSALLKGPGSVTVDESNNLLIVDANNHRFRRVDATTGIISTIAGGNTPFPVAIREGSRATDVWLSLTHGIKADSQGNIYFISFGAGSRVWRIDAKTEVLKVVAGTDGFDDTPAAVVGDGGPATKAFLDSASDIAFDGEGNLLIADTFNNRIRRVDAQTGIITTVAGSGPTYSQAPDPVFSGDGGPATGARLALPGSICLDKEGNIFIGDSRNERVRRVDARTGIITTVAGKGLDESTGDGGPATSAGVVSPQVVGFDRRGNLYVKDFVNRYIVGPVAPRIRRIDLTTGLITTLAVPFPGRDTATRLGISEAKYSKKKLTIDGFNIGLPGAKVMINNQDVSRFTKSAVNGQVVLKGSEKKLNLRPGVNQIMVRWRDITSNTFELSR